MQNLKSLQFTSLPKNTDSPILQKRAKLIRRLEDQKALHENPLYVAVDHVWEINSEGRKQLAERKRKVRPWWREDITGKVFLTVRYGQRNIEFEKGRPAIALASKDAISAVLDILIHAARDGELDVAIETMKKARPMPKKAA